MPDRLTADWLASYLELTANLEAPEATHLWTALVLISAATRRKIYLDMNYGKIYPNLYVIMVAESARARKSTAMDFGHDLLVETFPDIRIMQDSMTSQGLIKSLNHKVSIIKGDKIEEELRSDVTIFADEIANLFSYERTRSAQMVIFLTTAYNCRAIYDHTTVRDSTIRLYNLYPVLIGCTDPRNLKVLPDDAVAGLTGRLIWVIESERRKNNPGWKHKNSTELLRLQCLREYLIHDLKRISNLQGEMIVEQEAQQVYSNWYEVLSMKQSPDPTTDAFYYRCHVTVLRVATLLSLATSDNLVVTSKHMRGAITLIEAQLPEVKRVALWSGTSQYEQHRAKFIHFLQNSPHGVSSRRRLLKYMGIPVEEFDKLVATLVQDGSIEVVGKVGSEIVIKLTKQGFGQEK